MGISMMSDFNYAMEELEELFCSAFISRTMVITGDDIETRRFLAALDVHDHGTTAIFQEDVEDSERPNRYLDRLRFFQAGEFRVLVISYDVWFQLRETLETYVSEHNAMVFGSVSHPRRNFVMSWVKDAHYRGYKPSVPDIEYHTIVMGDSGEDTD